MSSTTPKLKILLLGEFSGFHTHLAAGLRRHGHEVTTASLGDGWKAINSDLSLGPTGPAWKDRFRRLVTSFRLLPKFAGHDVVQIISPAVFPGFLFNAFMILIVWLANKRLFMTACGEDSFFYRESQKFMRYSPIPAFFTLDAKRDDVIWLRRHWLLWNMLVARLADGVIPSMIEFGCGYESYKSCRRPIPIPFDLTNFTYRPLQPKRPAVFQHGENRAGFKGTDVIDFAASKIAAEHPAEVVYQRTGQMPYGQYVATLENVTVVLDQVRTYSYGYNALIGLALGKIVVSGAETEALSYLGIHDCPILNGLPDPEALANLFETIIANSDKWPEISAASRGYVETHHSAEKVASRYIETWLTP